MISWIQNHLIRHGRWIFLTLLTVIIVAFVFTIGNTPGCTSNNSAYEERNFYGYDLNSPHDMRIVTEKVSLSAILNTGRPIQNEQQFQSQVMSRIALLNLADEVGIPAPDQETLAEYIKTKASFRGADGQFSRDAYISFVDNIESNPRVPKGLVITVLEDDFRIEQIGTALSGPGYVLPSEARAQTQRTQTTFKLATAQLSYANFAPAIEPSEEALKAFYAANTDRYVIPERINASYAFFTADKYTSQVAAPEESELREHFIANRARFVADYQAAQSKAEDATAEKPAVTFEDVREAVAEDLAKAAALRTANEAAQSFAYALYRDEIKKDSAAFNTLLNDSGLTLKKIEPYTAEGAARRALSTEMLESGFALSNNRYYSDAYELDGGFGVLIFENKIAPETPEFATVAAEVAADFAIEEKRRLFSAKGESLEADLKAKLAEGTTFAEAAKALELNVKEYDSFTAADAPKDLSPAVLQKAQGMRSDEVSPMLLSNGIGTFIYVEEKSTPEIAADNEDFTQAQSFLSRYASYTSSSALVNELIARGAPANIVAPE